MQTTLKKNYMQLILNHPFMEKWSILGFFGTGLMGFSIPLGGDSGIITAVSGLSVVFFSLYQKYQDEIRKREKHKMLMQLLQQKKDEGGESVDEIIEMLK